MIAHPFEIKASATDARPHVLMITWRGAPAQTIAEIYLPAVAAVDVIALADTLYGRHRLTATDANTLQFPGSDLTLIPIPAGAGAYAGLLSVDARPSVPVGHDFTVSVRQLSPVSARVAAKPEFRDVAANIPVATEGGDRVGAQSALWRRVQGAFQFTFSGRSEQVVALEQVRLLSWLKWRVGVTPAANRWNLVLKRYLKQTESLVWDLGTDPNSVAPSEIGTVGSYDDGHFGAERPPLATRREHEEVGKVAAMHYDRFGDFRGFTIITERGDEQDYVSIEPFVEELVRTAWVERSLLRVASDEHHTERPDQVTLLRYH